MSIPSNARRLVSRILVLHNTHHWLQHMQLRPPVRSIIFIYIKNTSLTPTAPEMGLGLSPHLLTGGALHNEQRWTNLWQSEWDHRSYFHTNRLILSLPEIPAADQQLAAQSGKKMCKNGLMRYEEELVTSKLPQEHNGSALWGVELVFISGTG